MTNHMNAPLGYGIIVTRILKHLRVNMSRKIWKMIAKGNLITRSQTKTLAFSKKVEILARINKNVTMKENYNAKIYGMNWKRVLKDFFF